MQRLAIIGAGKLSLYLQRNLKKEDFARVSYLLPTDFSVDEIEESESQAWYELMNENIRFRKFASNWIENSLTRTMVELLVLKSMFPQMAALLELVAKGNDQGVMLETALLVCMEEGMSIDNIEIIQDAYDSLELLFMAKHKSVDILKDVLKCDERILGYFSENDNLDRELQEVCDIRSYNDNQVQVYGYKNELEDFSKGIEHVLENDKEIALIIRGEKESGRLQCAKYISKEIGVNLLTVPYWFLTDEKRSMEHLRKVVRECLLSDAVLCVLEVEKNTEAINKMIGFYQKNLNQLIILHAKEEVKLLPSMEVPSLEYLVKKPDRTVSFEIWKGFLEEKNLESEVDYSEISSLINMNAGQVKKAVDAIMLKKEMTNVSVSSRDIFKICYQILDDGRYENVHRVEPGYTFEDIKLTDKNLELLKDIRDQVLYRRKVYDEWGMGKKYAYGRSISVLLSGPPGTGKTMAVHALASELGLDLYKVDLSQVVDKYIGETEKRLEEIFDRAQKCNMILFFDEADAVMGKRTDTNDARDKSSNSQIAFILQRIEEFDGIVFLATNFMRNIDSAFLRRIRYVISFEMPEKDSRMEIWKSAFTSEIPLSEDIDFEYLASTFDFTGAVIKNVVLNAVFFAASRNQQVNMEMIMKAIQRESYKDRSLISGLDLGRYEYLLK